MNENHQEVLSEEENPQKAMRPSVPFLSPLVRRTIDPFRVPIFLSYTTPYNAQQQQFLDRIIEELERVLVFPRTLFPTDQYIETPLASIRRMIYSSYGLVSVAFRRVLIEQAIARPGTDREQVISNTWLPSPYSQIEPSMAYQYGLPLLILVENGVDQGPILGGIYEKGAAPFTILNFSVADQAAIDAFFQSNSWREILIDWVGRVRSGYIRQTNPKFRYDGDV